MEGARELHQEGGHRTQGAPPGVSWGVQSKKADLVLESAGSREGFEADKAGG